MTRPLSITVIGPGRVGQTLLRLGHSSGVFELADILARRPDAAAAARDFAGGGRAITGFEDLRPADLFLLTVPDDQLAGVAGDLARQGLPPAVAALAGSAKDSTGCALPVCQPASANGASSAAG